jgi:type I restriction enzyme S subunit
MSFPRYPKYKDSGVEWLGDVPEHWSVMRFQRCVDVAEGQIDPEDVTFSRMALIAPNHIESATGRLLGLETATEQGAESGKYLCKAGDVVYSKIRPALRKVCIAPEDCLCSADMYPLRSHSGLSNPFLFWLILSEEFSALAVLESERVAMPKINRESLKAVALAVPSPREQPLITEFLDRETAKIDALVGEQRRLIELLKEKRQAVISHAVTKGLNPHAPMKPSGIEWLGDVPQHWEIGRVRNYFRTCSGGTPNTSHQELYYADEEDGIPWVRTTDLQNDVLRCAEVFITEQALADTACLVLPPGTVMVAMYGGEGTVGKNGLLAIPAAINQAVCGLLPSTTHSPEYAFRFMQFYRPHWMIGAESSRKDPNISQERVRNAPFPRPPRKEQEAIVRFLEAQLQEFDKLTTEAERAIDLLQERRTALISAAVTGKIDVRGLVDTEAA